MNREYPALDRSLAFGARPKPAPRARTQADLVRDPQFMADADAWVRQEYRDQAGRYRQYMERTKRPNGREAQRLMWADPEQWSDDKKVAMYMDDIRYMKNNTLGAVRSALADRPRPVAEALTRGFAAHDSLQWGTPEGMAGLPRGAITDPLTFVPMGRAAANAVPAIRRAVTHAADKWALDTALDAVLKGGLKYAIGKPANNYVEEQGAD